MAVLTWTPEAITWLKEIHDYIAEDNPDAARRVVAGIQQRARVLRDYPKLGHVYRSEPDGEVRLLLYGHYRIAYLLASEDLVHVLGVFHAAMDLARQLP